MGGGLDRPGTDPSHPVTRILALVGDCYGGPGGIARYNQDLFEALAEGDADILILPRLGDASGLALPAGIRQLPPVFGRLAFLFASLLAAWRHRPVDVVFCGHVYMAPLAWIVARLTCARFWVQTHGAETWVGRRTIVRRAIETADMVTTVSRGTRHILMAWADLAPARVRVLPDTVRDMFVPGIPSPELAERLQLGPGPLLLTVGRLSASERYKGHEHIFAALPVLRARFPTLVHVVAGSGDDRARLEQRARELAQASDAVRFLGFVPEEDLPDLYRLADLYVMPSSQEGFGIVYLEAAACGLKVVGGLGGGSADAVPDERIGVLVDPMDEKALVDAIVRLLGQGEADQAAVDPYRKPQFSVAARLLLARLRAYPRRIRGAS
jgi:phosphatidylinositol alpha-1,6-mannosyltransferase